MRRIAILIPNYSVCKSLTTLNTAALLAEEGYEVEVITNVSLEGCSPIKGVKMYSRSSNNLTQEDTVREKKRTPMGKVAWWTESRLGWVPGMHRLITKARGLWGRSLLLFIRWAFSICRDKDYTCLIGSDPPGLIAATILGWRFRAPVAYHSLELYLWRDSISLTGKWQKALEAWCNRRCVFTIIQDQDRARCLIRENHIDRSQIVIMPVAGLGDPSRKKTSFLRRKLKIPDDKVIILQVGGVFHFNMCLELAQAAQDFPDSWVLVLHGFPYSEPYVQSILTIAPKGKVVLSLQKIPLEQMDDLVASADIGVALYRNLGPNFYYTGSASNKLVDYLKHGLPVIVSDFPSLRQVIERYQCGICIDDPSQLTTAIQRVLGNYHSFSQRAIACYRERYDARLYIGEVLERIEELENSSSEKCAASHGRF